jgi:Na+/melibiose symporter-like transporter
MALAEGRRNERHAGERVRGRWESVVNLKAAKSSQRLRLSTILPFAAPSLPLYALGVVVFVYLPPYFAGHLKVGLTLVGSVWMLVRLIDIPVDLALATAMDHTRTPLGRYRVWLMVGGPALMLALYKLFMAPVGFSGLYLTVWLLVMYLGTSIVGLAHVSWGATLATRYHERSRLFGVVAAVGVSGTMMALLVFILGGKFGRSDAQSVQDAGWFLILMLPPTIALAAARTPETIAPETDAKTLALKDILPILLRPDLMRLFVAQMALTLGPGWMSAIYLYFFRSSRGFSTGEATILLAVYILSGIPGSLLTAAVARRIGKHRTLMITTAAFSLGVISVIIVPKHNLLASAPSLILTGMMAAGFDLTVRAMLADIGDEVRLAHGKERSSLLYATNGMASKIASAFSIGLTYPLLAMLGFNPADGAANTAAAIANLERAFLIGPIIFVMLGGACVIGWKLDARRQGEVRDALEARDAELEGAG